MLPARQCRYMLPIQLDAKPYTAESAEQKIPILPIYVVFRHIFLFGTPQSTMSEFLFAELLLGLVFLIAWLYYFLDIGLGSLEKQVIISHIPEACVMRYNFPSLETNQNESIYLFSITVFVIIRKMSRQKQAITEIAFAND